MIWKRLNWLAWSVAGLVRLGILAIVASPPTNLFSLLHFIIIFCFPPLFCYLLAKHSRRAVNGCFFLSPSPSQTPDPSHLSRRTHWTRHPIPAPSLPPSLSCSYRTEPASVYTFPHPLFPSLSLLVLVSSLAFFPPRPPPPPSLLLQPPSLIQTTPLGLHLHIPALIPSTPNSPLYLTCTTLMQLHACMFVSLFFC